MVRASTAQLNGSRDLDKVEFDFEPWFDNLAMLVPDACGVKFLDTESVRADYDAGRNVADVADEISAEYLSLDQE